MEQEQRASPLTSVQRVQLMKLIKEKGEVIHNKSIVNISVERKRRAWEEVTAAFNAFNTDQAPRTVTQLRRCFERLKAK